MEAWEYSYIRRETLKLTGIDLNSYKGPQMQRRLGAYLQRSGQPTWVRFFALIREDPVALAKFRDYLTINVSSFFRDPEKYSALRDHILPELLRGRSTLRVWSAGCAHGQEAYSLAILLAEMTTALRQHFILATDVDTSALAHASAGGPYTPDQITNVPPDWLERSFVSRDNGYWVNDRVRRRVVFRAHNLLTDPFENNFDLIVCRNVVIYFTPPVKEALYQRFAAALRPGGVLFVGGTEVISKAAHFGLQPTGISFYRRLAPND